MDLSNGKKIAAGISAFVVSIAIIYLLRLPTKQEYRSWKNVGKSGVTSATESPVYKKIYVLPDKSETEASLKDINDIIR